jgi:glycerophosphoryl diester phosphodiesterase
VSARTLDIAHRGASRDAPENTLEAFRLAVAQRADMIETDLHLSRDGQVPLYHDSALRGRPLAELSLAEIRAAHAGVPTLEEALDAVGAEIPFNLELKALPDDRTTYRGLEQRVLAELDKRGLLARTLFSSFYDAALARLRELEPAARIGLLVSTRSAARMLERAESLRAEAIHPARVLVREDVVAEIHRAGFRVNVFTVDDPADQRRLIEWGVDGIFTNVPAQLREILGDLR